MPSETIWAETVNEYEIPVSPLSFHPSLWLRMAGRSGQIWSLFAKKKKKELIFTSSDVCLFCNALDLNGFTELNGHALEMPQNSLVQNTALSA